MLKELGGQLEPGADLLTDSIVVASKEQVCCDLNGEVVILNLSNGTYYGLDTIGAYVWNLIQEPKIVGDLVTALLEEYDVDRNRCEQELAALLRDLASEKLVSIRPPEKAI
jgi:hypothetical protein